MDNEMENSMNGYSKGCCCVSGATATAIGLSVAGIVFGLGAWAFGNYRAKSAENLIASQQSANQNLNNLMVTNNAAERLERINHQTMIEQAIYHRDCPQKVSIWSTQPCGCFEPKCNSCGC